MLPDFPDVKAHASRAFLRAVRLQMPQHEPLLRGIRSTRIHEGEHSLLNRADGSSDPIAFRKASAELSISREQMRRFDMDALLAHIAHLAEQFAGQQVQMMLSTVSEAVEKVGNVVSAKELGAKEAFLEMERRLQVDFDPVTLQPKGVVLVLHPSQLETWKARTAEWEKDSAFVEELARIRAKQIEDWRAREDSRKLVD